MKKVFNLRLDETIKTELEAIAKTEKRSLNQQIEKVLVDFYDNYKADQRKNQKRVSVDLGDL